MERWHCLRFKPRQMETRCTFLQSFLSRVRYFWRLPGGRLLAGLSPAPGPAAPPLATFPTEKGNYFQREQGASRSFTTQGAHNVGWQQAVPSVTGSYSYNSIYCSVFLEGNTTLKAEVLSPIACRAKRDLHISQDLV